MKRGLMRPTAALFPLVLLAAGLYSPGKLPEELFIYWCLIQLLSLCSVDAFRNAAAREPGMRRVDRRFTGAIPMILLGVAAAFFVSGIKTDNIARLMPLAAAGCITIEQLFEERMYALGRNADGVVLSIIANLLLLVGLLLDAGGGVAAPVENMFTLCGAGLGMLVSVATSYIVEPAHGFSLVPRNVGFFPKAAVQGMLYPALIFAIVVPRGVETAMPGMILWRLSRTVCRRAGDESRPLNLLLAAAAGAAVVLCQLFELEILRFTGGEALFIGAQGMLLAMICALIVFCAPGWRIYTGTVMIIAAFAGNIVLPDAFPYAQYAGIGMCVVAVILNLHKAFLRKV